MELIQQRICPQVCWASYLAKYPTERGSEEQTVQPWEVQYF